jgi:hypothetical protein
VSNFSTAFNIPEMIIFTVFIMISLIIIYSCIKATKNFNLYNELRMLYVCSLPINEFYFAIPTTPSCFISITTQRPKLISAAQLGILIGTLDQVNQCSRAMWTTRARAGVMIKYEWMNHYHYYIAKSN